MNKIITAVSVDLKKQFSSTNNTAIVTLFLLINNSLTKLYIPNLWLSFEYSGRKASYEYAKRFHDKV